MFKNLKINSIDKNKIKRYLAYALGEVILVVFGILIALQVNNRNVDALKQEQELKLLAQVNDALVSDTLNLKFFADRIRYNTQMVGRLIEVLESDQTYHDSLDTYFAMVVTPFMWSESNSAYNTLISKGVDIITNDEIRNDIITIHTSLFEMLKYLDDGVYIKYPYIHAYCLKNFDRVGSEAINKTGQFMLAKMKPNDYNSLKADTEYRAMLQTVKSQQEVFLTIIGSTRSEIRSTIKKINKEIEARR